MRHNIIACLISPAKYRTSCGLPESPGPASNAGTIRSIVPFAPWLRHRHHGARSTSKSAQFLIDRPVRLRTTPRCHSVTRRRRSPKSVPFHWRSIACLTPTMETYDSSPATRHFFGPSRLPSDYNVRRYCVDAATRARPTIQLAWISTGPDLPNMVLGQTAHFRALSLRNYYAKWCADSPIVQRLLAQRSRDSGQFRSLLDEEMLGAGLHQRTNWPTSYSKILESRESVSVSDVREFSFRGNPG